MKRYLLFIAAMVLSFAAQAAEGDPVITFFSTSRPAGCPDVTATVDGNPITSGSTVALNKQVIVTATKVACYHVEWYLNGEKQQLLTGYEQTFTATADQQIEAR